MKIRHKQSGVELEGKFAKFSQGSIYGKPRNLWIEPSNAASQYSCDEWEAVPEWVDVSGDVEVSADGEAMMGDGRVLSRCPVGYRFRKVRLSTGIPPFSGERWAFIVEREVGGGRGIQ